MSEHDSQQQPGSDQTRGDASQTERGRSGGGGGERRRGRRRHTPSHAGASGQQQPQQRRQEASLNMSELRELVELFTSHGLTDFELENEEIRVRLSRNTGMVAATAQAVPSPTGAQSSPATEANAVTMSAAGAQQTTANAASTTGGAEATGAATAPAANSETATAEELHIITSPIVGTFYRSPSPTSEAFVRVGSRVEPDTVVCIIEAMKLMNEIQAETTGTVEKIYVENGQPVEYGQPLFGIKK